MSVLKSDNSRVRKSWRRQKMVSTRGVGPIEMREIRSSFILQPTRPLQRAAAAACHLSRTTTRVAITRPLAKWLKSAISTANRTTGGTKGFRAVLDGKATQPTRCRRLQGKKKMRSLIAS